VAGQSAGGFGELLRQLRTDAGLTQEKLAFAAGLSPRAISDLERGVNKTARKDTARLLADALLLSGTARAGFEAASLGLPARAGPPARSVAATTPVLPHDIRSFTDRETDFEQLLATVTGAGGLAGIYAIDGMAGVGKSAFAVHAAHFLAPRFPDGQIFLRLHAHTAGHRPVDPIDALASLLLTTGVPAEQIPATLQRREELWRSHMAGKRVLLLLDDAASHEQVTPLLPGAPGSLVLVTSRRHLSALGDAVSMCLKTLGPPHAAALMIRLAGRPDLDPADPAVGEINQLCGHLPLAIEMLARRLHHHPAWSAADLARELAAARDRLGFMHAENLSVAAAFDLSYLDLTSGQQRLFRRLGLHPGTDIDSHASAALDDCSPAEARQRLDELFDQHLVTEPVIGRYRLHDLIREHARALAEMDDSAGREAAVTRLTDYYVRAAATIGRHFNRGGGAAGDTDAGIPSVRTRAEAARWMEAERANMHAIVDYAAQRGWPGPGIAIAGAMSGFLRIHGHWTQMRILHTTALETARKTGYRQGEAGVLTSLGIVQRLIGDYEAAAAALTRALELCEQLDDLEGQATALVPLGIVQRLTVSFPAAAATLSRALRLHERTGYPLGQADALSELGCVQRLSGEYEAATASYRRALDLYRELDDQHGLADSLRGIGRVQHETGDHAAVVSAYARALQFYSDLGDRLGQAHTLNFLGIAQHVSDDYLAAEHTMAEALALYRDLGHRLGQAEVLNSLGDLSAVSDPGQARDFYTQALALARDLTALLEEARALEGIGTSDIQDRKPGRDGTCLRQALALYHRLGSPHAARVQETLRVHGL
jgi:tetratricopeptide (TPR) repeat protein/transcriptional regulator with XRE-family HTH domain